MSHARWALFALSFILATLYGSPVKDWALGDGPAWAVAAFKASSIALLALIAAIARGPRLLVAALLFGALGDALLAPGSEAMFLAGAGSFMIGHLFYIVLFTRSRETNALRTPWRALSIVALAAAALLSTNLLVPRESTLFAPLSIYTGVLTFMVMSSVLLPRRGALATIGAVLFFISDGFVAANMFHPQSDPTLAFWLSFSGWMIYWAGQAGLCLGGLTLGERR
ncbi:MAG: lysoplasmalogenase [Hyphomonadaceae bacterium]